MTVGSFNFTYHMITTICFYMCIITEMSASANSFTLHKYSCLPRTLSWHKEFTLLWFSRKPSAWFFTNLQRERRQRVLLSAEQWRPSIHSLLWWGEYGRSSNCEGLVDSWSPPHFRTWSPHRPSASSELVPAVITPVNNCILVSTPAQHISCRAFYQQQCQAQGRVQCEWCHPRVPDYAVSLSGTIVCNVCLCVKVLLLIIVRPVVTYLPLALPGMQGKHW